MAAAARTLRRGLAAAAGAAKEVSVVPKAPQRFASKEEVASRVRDIAARQAVPEQLDLNAKFKLLTALAAETGVSVESRALGAMRTVSEVVERLWSAQELAESQAKADKERRKLPPNMKLEKARYPSAAQKVEFARPPPPQVKKVLAPTIRGVAPSV
jgi:hypothetical protein